VWSNAVAARSIPGAVLAHQGGWDEILLVAGPMLFVVFLLWLAKRRVTRAGTVADGPAGDADGAR
jgi:hypothetical protein